MRVFRLSLSGPALAVAAAFAVAAPLALATPAAAATSTALRISAPATAPAGGAITLTGRLVRTGGTIAGRPVIVQRLAGTSWSQVASFTTGTEGLGSVRVTVPSTSRFRMHFRGDSAYAASTSPTVVVSVQTLGDRAVAEGKRHQGKPYSYGAVGPDRFDCSGFTRYVFSRLGKPLPHNSGMQRDAARVVANSARRPGDLIFTVRNGRISHVGLFASGTDMWSPVQTGDHVRLQSFAGRTFTVGRVD